nr:hypothetical protein CFP56_13393 [Quercus suber]
MTRRKPWSRTAKSSSSFRSYQRAGSNLRTFAGRFGQSVACLVSPQYARKRSTDDGKPTLQSTQSEPLPRHTSITSAPPGTYEAGLQQQDPNWDSTTIRHSVLKLTQDHERLRQTRRRLAHDHVDMLSEMSNLSNALRFVQETQEALWASILTHQSCWKDDPNLVKLHEQLKADCDTFQTYLAAWKQAKANYSDTSAMLERHDGNFVTALENQIAQQPSLQPGTPSARALNGHVAARRASETIPQLLVDFHDQNGQVRMLRESLLQLEIDFQEELAARDFSEDQGVVHNQPREHFMHDYAAYRAQTRQKLTTAEARLAQLEEKCRNEKLDMSEIRRASTDLKRTAPTAADPVTTGPLYPMAALGRPLSATITNDSMGRNASSPLDTRSPLSRHSAEANGSSHAQIVEHWFDNLHTSSDSVHHYMPADDELPYTNVVTDEQQISPKAATVHLSVNPPDP